jgi:hypothetical protein
MKRIVKAGIKIAQQGRVMKATQSDTEILLGAGCSVALGKSYDLNSDELEVLRHVLNSNHGVPIEDLQPGAMRKPDEVTDRITALARSNDEKSGTDAVFAQMVMVKPQPGRAMRLGGKDIELPDGAAFHLSKEMAGLVDTNGVILIENETAFMEFHRLMFAVPEAYQDYLLVFRGKPRLARQDAAECFLKALDVPVIVFSDYDPAGLVIALRAPNSRGMLIPPFELFEKRLSENGSRDHYFNQAGYHGICEEELTGEMKEIWKRLKRTGRGVVQEAFIAM